jgi:hypothetical protein
LNTIKVDRQAQQLWYHDLLARQDNERNMKMGKGHAMTKKEKAINMEPLQAYKKYDHHLTVLIPGFANSKYVHPHAPEAKYAEALPHIDRISNSTARSKNVFHLGNQVDAVTPTNGGQATMNKSVQILTPTPGTDPMMKKRSEGHTRINPNIFREQQLSHNPITNPIPNHYENPYLLKQIRYFKGENGTSTSGTPRYLASVANNQILTEKH